MSPKRIQRQRTKGWRMPEGAVYVGRGSRWGNPWRVLPNGVTFDVRAPGGIDHGSFRTQPMAAVHACKAYLWQIRNHPNVVGFTADEARAELVGRDLACWCDLSSPCHADVLLELANGPEGPP